MKEIAKKLKVVALMELACASVGLTGTAIVLDFSLLQSLSCAPLFSAGIASIFSAIGHYASAKLNDVNPELSIKSIFFQPLYDKVVEKALVEYVEHSCSEQEKCMKIALLHVYCSSQGIVPKLLSPTPLTRKERFFNKVMNKYQVIKLSSHMGFGSIRIVENFLKDKAQVPQSFAMVKECYEQLAALGVTEGLFAREVTRGASSAIAPVLMKLHDYKLTEQDLAYMDSFNKSLEKGPSAIDLNDTSVEVFKELMLHDQRMIGRCKTMMTNLSKWDSLTMIITPLHLPQFNYIIDDSNVVQRLLALCQTMELEDRLQSHMPRQAPVETKRKVTKI